MDNSQKSPILFQTTAAVTQLNQIQGFDPLKFLRRTKTAAGGEIWKLDLRYQKLWFRLAYPKGRLNLNRLIFTDSKAAFEANVYFNREDKEPAGQFTAMCTAEEAVNGDFVREAQDAALAQALTNAGFGIQFADVMVDKGGERYGCGISFPGSAPAQETAHRNASAETAAVSPDHAVTEDFQRKEEEVPVKGIETRIVIKANPSSLGAAPSADKEPLSQPQNKQDEVFQEQSGHSNIELAAGGKESNQGNESADPILPDEPMAQEEMPVCGTVEENPPQYTASTPVTDILKHMTLGEAKRVLVQEGTCRGLTMDEVAKTRMPSLKWFVYGYKGHDNIIRAAAQMLMDELSAPTEGQKAV